MDKTKRIVEGLIVTFLFLGCMIFGYFIGFEDGFEDGKNHSVNEPHKVKEVSEL